MGSCLLGQGQDSRMLIFCLLMRLGTEFNRFFLAKLLKGQGFPVLLLSCLE